MTILCFGQQDWDYCWTAKQQLMTRLARRGHRILYVNPDLSDGLDGRSQWAAPNWRTRIPGLEEVQDGLHVLTQGSVPAGFGRRVSAKLRLWGIRAACAHLQMFAPVALALRPDRLWLMRAASPAAMAYYAVDEWTGFGGLSEASRQHLRAREEDLLREVDVALAVSPRLVERFRLIQPNTHHLENGADVEHFSPAALRRAPRHEAVAALPGPRIGFVGQVDERLDQDLVLSLADARPQWHLVLAGRVKPGVDVSRLRARGNIHLLGYQPYQRLPGVLRDIDVCIVPYHRTPLTESCNPLKVYEYLATGLPVVSVPLDGLLSCREAVVLADTPQEFCASVGAALADPQAGRERRLRVAAMNAWPHRVDRLEQHLENARLAAAGARSSRCWTSGRRVSRVGARLDPKEESLRHVHRRYERARLRGTSRMTYLALRLGGAGYYALRVGTRLAGRLAGDRWPLGVRKILVARRGFLGDTIAFLPTLRALRRRYPHARIVLAVQPGFPSASLLDEGCVDEIRSLDFFRRGRGGRLRGVVRLFLEGYDLLVTGIWYSLVPEAMYCGAPRHVGLYDGHPLEELATRVVSLDPNRHEADNHLALVEALGEQVELPSRVPRLSLDDGTLPVRAERLRDAMNIPQDRAILLIHPGSKRESRRWPAERFAELAGLALQRHPELHVVFTGTNGEAQLVDRILGQLSPGVRSRATSGIGMTDLASLVAMVRAAKLVICNDTGIMHVARACGVPLVAVLGPENDRRWGPYPFGPAPAVTVRAAVPCAPCARDRCEALYCMRSTAVADVLRAAEALLRDDSGAAADDETRGPERAVTLPVLGQLSAAGEVLYPVDRRSAHLSWRDVADAGLELPVVSIIVLPAGAALRNGAAAARRQFMRSTAWQSYPRLEVVIVERGLARAFDEPWPGSDHEAGETLPPTKRVRVPLHADGAACLEAGLQAAGGEFLLVTRGGGALAADRIGTDVAVHMRGPGATLVDAAGRPVYLDQLSPAAPDAACELSWPRQALAGWLDQLQAQRAGDVTTAARTPGAAEATASGSGSAKPPRGAVLTLSGLQHFVRGRARGWRERWRGRRPTDETTVAAAAADRHPQPLHAPKLGDDR